MVEHFLKHINYSFIKIRMTFHYVNLKIREYVISVRHCCFVKLAHVNSDRESVNFRRTKINNRNSFLQIESRIQIFKFNANLNITTSRCIPSLYSSVFDLIEQLIGIYK